MRHPPYAWKCSWELRRLPSPRCDACREWRRRTRLCSCAAFRCRDKFGTSRLLVQPHEVDVDNGSEQTFRVALANPQWEQPPSLPHRVLPETAVPLSRGELGREVRRRQNRHRAICRRCGTLHFVDEVRSSREVPGLKNRLVASLLEFPGDP